MSEGVEVMRVVWKERQRRQTESALVRSMVAYNQLLG
jgi:hypothetical protein